MAHCQNLLTGWSVDSVSPDCTACWQLPLFTVDLLPLHFCCTKHKPNCWFCLVIAPLKADLQYALDINSFQQVPSFSGCSYGFWRAHYKAFCQWGSKLSSLHTCIRLSWFSCRHIFRWIKTIINAAPHTVSAFLRMLDIHLTCRIINIHLTLPSFVLQWNTYTYLLAISPYKAYLLSCTGIQQDVHHAWLPHNGFAVSNFSPCIWVALLFRPACLFKGSQDACLAHA